MNALKATRIVRALAPEQPLPRGYGIAWRDHFRDLYICLPIPLNVFAGLLCRALDWLRRGQPPRLSLRYIPPQGALLAATRVQHEEDWDDMDEIERAHAVARLKRTLCEYERVLAGRKPQRDDETFDDYKRSTSDQKTACRARADDGPCR